VFVNTPTLSLRIVFASARRKTDLTKTVQGLSCTFGFQAFFSLELCPLALDDEDRVSGDMVNLNIGDAGGGNAATSVAVSGVLAPQGTQLPHNAQPLRTGAGGGPIGGESSLVIPAPVVIHGKTSREVIHAVGARLAAMNTERAASAARVDPVTRADMDIGDGSMEVPRPSYNRQWLNVVLLEGLDL
jgi:hypothetical protein